MFPAVLFDRTRLVGHRAVLLLAAAVLAGCSASPPASPFADTPRSSASETPASEAPAGGPSQLPSDPKHTALVATAEQLGRMVERSGGDGSEPDILDEFGALVFDNNNLETWFTYGNTLYAGGTGCMHVVDASSGQGWVLHGDGRVEQGPGC